MKKLFFLALVFLFACNAFGQLVVTAGGGAAGVTGGIAGPGITMSAITINCPSNQYGTFSGGGTAFGMTNGLLMTTGNATDILGANTANDLSYCNGTSASDPQLTALSAQAVVDPCIIEFDVSVQCNSLTIVFVFGSDEYLDYVSAGYNDAFGFFVSGPNPSGGSYNNFNIATLPSGSPVSIDNVNNVSNPAYYIDNPAGASNSFDGYTTVLSKTINVTPCATYHFKLAIADASDCNMDSGILIDAISCTSPWTIATSSTPASCGASNGTATATVSGGIGPFTYSWSPSGGTGSTASGLAPGTYTVTVNDGLSCTPAQTATVTVGSTGTPPTINVSPSTTICNGASTTLTASGGTTYTWSPATGLSATTGATVTASPTTTTTYTVTGTGGCGSGTATTTVTVNPIPVINVPSASKCAGAPGVTLTATGATTYTWTPATGLSATTGSSVTANPATTTTYTITGTAGGCTGTTTATVTVNPVPVINVPPATICNGSSATLTASGATTYTWTPATGLSATTGTSVTANPAATTTYTVSGTSLGCTGTTTVTVTVNPIPVINVPPATICNGSSTTLTASGATTYTWSPATGLSATTGTSVTANPSATTTYTVSGTSAGCTGTTTTTVTVNPIPVINVPPATICNGSSATLTASGATTYTWSPATGLSATTGTSVTANPSATTTYTVSGTSAGCTGTTTVTVTVNPIPVINVPPATICNGSSTTLTASGATTYTWSPATGLSATTGTSVTANPAATTTYTVSGTSLGCTGTTTTTVTVNPIPVINVPSITICPGTSGTLTATGGTTYTWSPATGLSATTGASVTANPAATTTYTVTGTSLGCTGTTTTTVTVAGSLTINVPSATICPGSSTVLTATGATDYTWTPATGLSATTGSSVTASPAATTTYTITGTDPSGCSGTTTATVTVSASLAVSAAPVTICEGASDILTASGATDYTWSPATGLSATTGTSVTANPTTTTTYTVTGTDASGCSGTGTVTVTVNPLPDVIATPASESICDGQTTGIALSSSVAGTTFDWVVSATNVSGASDGSGASIAQTLSSIVPPNGTATYTVTPTAAGCVGTPVDVVINVGTIVINSIDTTGVLCFGGSDGTITINAPGATGYSIDGGTTFQPGNTFTVAAGTYPVVVENAGGCQGTGTAVVTEPTALTAPVSSTDETCAGACDGIGGTAPSGGTPPYTYTWSVAGAGSVPFLNTLCTGTHTVTVTDAHSCSVTSTITINGPLAVTITSTTPTQPQCNGGNDGSLVINASGTGTLSYSINNGATFQASNTFNTLTAGTYQVVVKDPNGCQATTTVVIGEPTAVTITASSDVNICIGQSTPISATGNGGTAPYTYTWDNGLPSAPNHTVSPAVTTTYNVSVTDNNGCGPATESITVTVNPALSVTASADQNICPGSNATISATASGGNGGPYTYTWSPGAMSGATQNVSPADTTTYTVTVSDGCGTPVATDVVVVNVLATPSVTFSADTTQGCTPVVVNFSHNEEPGTTCSWDFGDGSTSSNCDPQHVFTEPGCYDITLNVTSANGCTADSTATNMICVYAIPVAEFTFGPQPTTIFNPEIVFTNLTIGGVSYQWNFDGMGSSTQMHPTYIFPDDSTGYYNVCLTTVNNNGCADSTCHQVVIMDEFLMYVPNTFTPDGDGMNDIFLPIFQGEDPTSYEFYIFNRWGEVIFQSNNKLIGWDGTHKAIKCKEDVYVWKIKVRKEVNQDKREFTGHVNLLR